MILPMKINQAPSIDIEKKGRHRLMPTSFFCYTSRSSGELENCLGGNKTFHMNKKKLRTGLMREIS